MANEGSRAARQLRWLIIGAVVLGLLGWWFWWRATDVPERDPRSGDESSSASRPADVGSASPEKEGEQSRPSATAAAPGLQDSATNSAPAPAGAPAQGTGLEAADAGEAAASARAYLDQNAKDAQALVDRYCDEARALEDAGLGEEEKERQRDAWAFMVVRVDWEGGKRPPGLLRLSEPLRQRLGTYGAKWPTKITAYDLEGLDFTWMSALQQFDHWNVLRDVPSEYPEAYSFFDVPIPNFVTLIHWTKLRFAHALQTGELAPASAEVRHLAMLLRTTGLVIADMVAMKLLDLEREAHAAAAAAGMNVTQWQPWPKEALDRYRKLARSSSRFLLPGVEPAVMKKALDCNPIARCSAVYEGVGSHATMSSFAALDTRAEMNALADTAGCDARLIAWLRQNRPSTDAELLEGFTQVEGLAHWFSAGTAEAPPPSR